MLASRNTPIPVIKKRAAFLNVAKGVYMPNAAFVMQANVMPAGEGRQDAESRIGFTVTKKVGNAVLRNRVRRRLRAAVRALDDGLFEPGKDYVVVGRRETASIVFSTLCADLKTTLKKLAHGEGRSARPVLKNKKR